MLALVTGAAGFIGSHLSEALLDRGWEVRGVDNFSDYYPRRFKEDNLAGLRRRGVFSLVETDLSAADPAPLLDGADAVFHLAAQAGVRKSWGRDFAIYVQSNMLATQRLLEACRERRLLRFVFASSSSIYGDSADLPLKESSLPQPVSPYGVTKAAGEHLCRLYHVNFGVPAVSLRFFTVYGPRQRPDMAFHRFLKAIDAGETFRVFGDGGQSRDFTYVGDIVAGALAALDGRPGEAYNLGGGHRLALRDVIAMMEDIAGRKARIVFEATAKGDVRHTAADMSKAAADLGYRPAGELAAGLRAELEWLRRIYGA